MILKGNWMGLLLPQLIGNLFNFLIFLITGGRIIATTSIGVTAANANLKLLPSLTTGNNSKEIDDEAFVQFLKYVSQEQNFTSIVILTNWTNKNQDQGDYCVNLKYYMEHDQQRHQPQQQHWHQNALIPVLLLQSQQQDYILHGKFNSEFLTLICIPPLSASSSPSSHQVLQNYLLSALSKNLWYLRKNLVVIRMDLASRRNAETVKNVADILKFCDREQILNVIVISYEFPHNDLDYYSYSKFPIFQMRKQKWIIGETQLFPNQLRDVNGYTLRTIPDQILPKSMVYYDKNGQQKMCGYMGHFVEYFAKSINASLAFAFEVEVGDPIFYPAILNLTRNNTIDLAASITASINTTDWSEVSYPYELSGWCIMLPVEAEISPAEIFLAIMNPYFIMILITLCLCFTLLLIAMFKRMSGPMYRFYWVDLLLNDKAFRAVLGQGFPFHKNTLDYFVAYVFFLLFITGLVVVTLYGVFLGSYMTSPPKEPTIKSFADLDKARIKILINELEYNFINRSEFVQYHNLFQLASKDYAREHRNSLNTSYAYAAAGFLWHVLANQQKYFSRPLFRYSTDICFNQFMHYSLFLPLHSVFRESVHFAILNAYASGLYSHWYDLGFYELVSLGDMSFTDLAEPYKLKPITVADLKIIFIGFYISLLCSVGIFVIELFVSFMGKYITRYRKSKLKQCWS